MAKLADAKDLKSFFAQAECGFKSRPGHQLNSLRTKVLRGFPMRICQDKSDTIISGVLCRLTVSGSKP